MPFFKASKKNVEACSSVSEGLKRVYKANLAPLELTYCFHEFHSPILDDADFDAKPIILLVGQYSTGKTTFIKFLLNKEFPGMRIGSEPTTEKFMAVLYGQYDNIIPGNALAEDKTKPFTQLKRFGNTFLSRFQGSETNSPVLENLTLIDTPGILSGEKQRTDRGYEFTNVLEWFAERVDRIILLFDAYKLDISDEFKRSIEKLKRFDEKIRIVLNKADLVDPQELMRVYGKSALMWSLGKVLNTPEVSRVYIGSFWNEKLKYADNKELFEKEANDLFRDIQSLPRMSALRKLNDLIKRARLAKVHALIISSLKKEIPMFFNENKKKDLIRNLGNIYAEIQKTYNISAGDFPDLQEMQEKLEAYDFNKFKKFKELKKNLFENVDKMLEKDISRLMAMIPGEQQEQMKNRVGDVNLSMFDRDGDTPFAFGRGVGVDEGSMEPDKWIVENKKAMYDEIFAKLGPNEDGKLSAAVAKDEMLKSKLPDIVLRRIWALCDCDEDGKLNDEEFALVMHLIEIKKKGHELPNELPEHLVPPFYRKKWTEKKRRNNS